MRCADLIELISAYADGQAGPAQVAFIETHLTTCPRCRATLRRQVQTVRLLHQATAADDWPVPDLRLRITHAARTDGCGHRSATSGMVVGLVAVLVLCWAIAGSIGYAPQQAAWSTACGRCPRAAPRFLAPRALAMVVPYQGVQPPPPPTAGQGGAPAHSAAARRSVGWPGGMRPRPF